MAEVRVAGASLVYRGVGGDVAALDGVDLELAHGEAVSVIGPSGCGKSSLLLALAGLTPLTSGSIEVAGSRVRGPRSQTALILQDFGLMPWYDALRNAGLGLELRGVPAAERRERALEALRAVGIADFARAYPAELSGGMRQRLALARALALDADLVLMDEPLSAVDAMTREALQELLLELWRERRHTLLLVTHSIEEAVYLGHRVVVMTRRPGRVAAIVDNPGMGEPGHRRDEAYYSRCAELRALLAEEGAYGDVLPAPQGVRT